MGIKYIIWDLDGTLINGSEGVIKAVNSVLVAHHAAELSESQQRMLLTAPCIQDAFCLICGCSRDEASRLSAEYQQTYINHFLYDAHPHPGVLDTLRHFHHSGYSQAVVTNKQHDCATNLCHHFGIDQYCRVIIGAAKNQVNSKEYLIKTALSLLGAQHAQNAIYIGDLPSDKEAAAAAGTEFLGVNYGFGFSDDSHYVNTASDIILYINKK